MSDWLNSIIKKEILENKIPNKIVYIVENILADYYSFFLEKEVISMEKYKKVITKIMNQKYQLRHGVKSLNYLMDNIVYQIFKIVLLYLILFRTERGVRIDPKNFLNFRFNPFDRLAYVSPKLLNFNQDHPKKSGFSGKIFIKLMLW